MNLRVKLRDLIKGSIVAFIFFVAGILTADSDIVDNLISPKPIIHYEVSGINTRKEDSVYYPIKATPTFEKKSPNGRWIISVYRYQLDQRFFADYMGFISDSVVMIIKEAYTNEKNVLFTGDDHTGDPQWLGDNHVFFTARCGSSCRGLYLVNINSKQTLAGSLSFMFDKKGSQFTQFRDWFGKDFEMKGFVKEIHTNIKDEDAYLVFEMEDENKKLLGSKTFLFTGSSLEQL